MPFSDLVTGMDTVVEGVMQDFTATIHPRVGLPFNVLVTQSNPQFHDDFIPGSTTGSSILMLFIASSTYIALAVKPDGGDTVSVGGVDYDVVEVPVDSMGGATLHLRKRGKRWDL